MKFMFLLYGDESQWANATPQEIQQVMEAYDAFNTEVTDENAMVSGEGLETTGAATTVRVREGEPVLSDGPFAETREQLGGFYVLECADLDEAVRWASKIPAAQGGSVEIRPVMDYEAAAAGEPSGSQQATA